MTSLTTKRVITTEAPWVRFTLIGIALAFVFLFLVLPLAAVFTEALRKGFGAYLEGLREPDAWSAIKLTLLAAASHGARQAAADAITNAGVTTMSEFVETLNAMGLGDRGTIHLEPIRSWVSKACWRTSKSWP